MDSNKKTNKLSDLDISFLQKYRKDKNRLFCAVRIKYLRYHKRLPKSNKDISYLLDPIAKQLNIDQNLSNDYSWNNRISRTHDEEIRKYLNISAFTQDELEIFKCWLKQTISKLGFEEKKLEEESLAYLKQQRLEIPILSSLFQYINSACKEFEEDLFSQIESSLSSETQIKIDELLIDNSFEKKVAVIYSNLLPRKSTSISIDTLINEKLYNKITKENEKLTQNEAYTALGTISNIMIQSNPALDFTNKTPEERLNKIKNELSANNQDIYPFFLQKNIANSIHSESTTLSFLRKLASGISVETILNEVKKIEIIDGINLPLQIFKNTSWEILKKYTNRVNTEKASNLTKRDNKTRYVMISCFLYTKRLEIADILVELLIHITHKFYIRAEKKVDQEFLKQAKKLGIGARNKLFKEIAQASLDYPDEKVRDVIYAIIPEKLLLDFVDEEDFIDDKKEKYIIMKSSYSSHYRRILSPILNSLKFCSNNLDNNEVLKGLNIIKEHIEDKKPNLPDVIKAPMDNIIPKDLQNLVIVNGKTNKIYYELYILQILRKRLKCKDIWVQNSHFYQDPHQDLPGDFQAKKVEYFNLNFSHRV